MPKAPVVLAKALKPRLVVRRKLGVTENFSASYHAEFMHNVANGVLTAHLVMTDLNFC